MKIACIIPARLGSTRLPEKMMVDLEGKTLIQRVVERVRGFSDISFTCVATDHRRIFDHIKDLGYDVIMTNPTHNSGTDRVAEVASDLTGFSHIINVQGDEPFIHEEEISRIIKTLSGERVKIASLATLVKSQSELENPNCVKVVMDLHLRALYFSRSIIPYDRFNHSELMPYYRHIGIYGFEMNTLNEIFQFSQSKLERAEGLEQLRWLENGIDIFMGIVDDHIPGIDSFDDLERARAFLRK